MVYVLWWKLALTPTVCTDTAHEISRRLRLYCWTDICTVDLIPMSKRFAPCSLFVFGFFCPISLERNGSAVATKGRVSMPLDLSVTGEKCGGSNGPNSWKWVLIHDTLEKNENMLTEEQQEQKGLREYDAVYCSSVSHVRSWRGIFRFN